MRTPPRSQGVHHAGGLCDSSGFWGKKERKKTYNPREGWEDGKPPPHRDFEERCVVRCFWGTFLFTGREDFF